MGFQCSKKANIDQGNAISVCVSKYGFSYFVTKMGLCYIFGYSLFFKYVVPCGGTDVLY